MSEKHDEKTPPVNHKDKGISGGSAATHEGKTEAAAVHVATKGLESVNPKSFLKKVNKIGDQLQPTSDNASNTSLQSAASNTQNVAANADQITSNDQETPASGSQSNGNWWDCLTGCCDGDSDSD